LLTLGKGFTKSMHKDDAIIHPRQQAVSYDLGPFAVMAATSPDLNTLQNLLWEGHTKAHPLAMSRLYPNTEQCNVSLVGPMMGAPYAVYLMESLIAWGVRQVFFIGWCGAVSPDIHIGDIIVPDSAFIDEGTSTHYQEKSTIASTPSNEASSIIKKMLQTNHLPFHEGSIWCTDGFFRETPEKVTYFQNKGALAVEMEASALFTVGQFREVDVGALLIVSDELSSLSWQPGFKNTRFRDTRRAICEGLATLCQNL
jgi:purine-nucleoside phosphorylase